MITLVKLLVAHLVGDFVLQPTSWVMAKEKRKMAAPQLYLHGAIHGLLVMGVLWSEKAWPLAIGIMILHVCIDAIKLYAQKVESKRLWFFIDQFLHIITIIILWYIWDKPDLSMTAWFSSTTAWIYIGAILFITKVSAILMRILMTPWTNELGDSEDHSLAHAGKYIGILERLYVFVFVVLGHWEVIGFLVAAKSVFRFGDLRESHNRKLTEYMLIGTLTSFAIAIATGLAVLAMQS